MKKLILVCLFGFLAISTYSCRETEKKEVIIEKETVVEKEESEGILERAAKEADKEINEEINEEIDKIGNDD